MSANNWRTCPKCRQVQEANRKARINDARNAYGKAPIEKFTAMLDAANEQPELEESMRENYQLGVGSDGKFYVDYRASCENCDFEFSFKHDQDAMEAPQ